MIALSVIVVPIYALVVHHQTILRNKRCLLAYHQARKRAARRHATARAMETRA